MPSASEAAVPAEPTHVPGAACGLAFPTSIETFIGDGPEFLTRAFRATGAMSADNRVTAITRIEPFEGGGMGPKLKLDVTYERGEEGLHEALFAKFPRPFGDSLRALFAPVVEPEIRLYLLSRRPGFPVRVPKLYFGDYDPQTASSLLITERVAYGQHGIEACHDKALDHRLADPLPYYEALSRSGARLAGGHRAGLLGADAEQAFPFDPNAIDAFAAIPYSAEQLAEKLAILQQFAADAPALFPEDLRDPSFLQRFAAEAPLALEREAAVRKSLNHAADSVALCHWNLNLDNAWFDHGKNGTLEVGLLDWGATAQMNLAQSFFGMICAAELDFIAEHRDALLELWAREYTAAGGPAITAQDLRVHYRLSVAVLGVAWMIDAPSIIMRELLDYQDLSGRDDSRLVGNFLARAQRQLLMVFLREWQALDLGAALRDLAD
ncbi:MULTISPECIES: hypothetical protein [unclassified Novosphingobium]|uniref:hypothetical protein n=1 Tax=unclassified Novosphingobium TaxID=2644732 RepID=UPI001356D5A5|nr:MULTISPECIES: hypothetical protein [unclassified Novosphingobium]